MGKVDMMNTHPMICGTKGLLEIAERNQIKERSNIRADIFGYCFQKGSILLSRPIICLTRTRISLQKPLRKRHIWGRKKKILALLQWETKSVEHFLRSTWNFLERYQNSGNLCKSNWFKGTIEFVGNSWKSILPWAPLDSSPQASTFPSPHLRRGKSTFNHIMVITISPQKQSCKKRFK